MTSLAWLTASSAFIEGPPLAFRCVRRRYAQSAAVLDRELHPFARDDDLDARGLLVHLFLRLDPDAIKRVVAPVRVVVVQHEPLHLCFHGDVDRARDRGVP